MRPSSEPRPARMTTPVEGSVLHRLHGERTPDGLKIPVRGEWPEGKGRPVWINGCPARIYEGGFSGEVVLQNTEELIRVTSDTPDGPVIAQVRVVYVRNSQPRYRVAIDDNIFFLESIACERPRSLFDCFYLARLRALHETYGTKFALNLFFSTPSGTFSLDRFPDIYKGEFADNASWLTLAFHARSEFPDRPYQKCEPEVLAADYDLVANEILRFAGEHAYSPTTVTHWAMVRPDAHNVLSERGTRLLSGFFVPERGSSYTSDGEVLETGGENTEYDINYCLDRWKSALLNQRDLLKDFSSGLTFSKVELICNNTPADRVASVLEPLRERPDTAEVMDLLTHEQYFWPHYHNYLPDHFARCEAAIRWCTENGYTPVFFHEGLAGAPKDPLPMTAS